MYSIPSEPKPDQPCKWGKTRKLTWDDDWQQNVYQRRSNISRKEEIMYHPVRSIITTTGKNQEIYGMLDEDNCWGLEVVYRSDEQKERKSCAIYKCFSYLLAFSGFAEDLKAISVVTEKTW